MTVIKKIILNDKERSILKAALYLKGETYRTWIEKCTGKKTKTTGHLSNVFTKGVITKKQYDLYFKDLDIPFLNNFVWEEEIKGRY